MTPAWLAVPLLAGLAAVLAALLARRDRRHLPVSIAITAATWLDVLQGLLALVLIPARGTLLAEVGGDVMRRVPLSGWARAAFHVDEARMLAWPALVAWLAMTAYKNETAPEANHGAVAGEVTNARTLRLRAPAVKTVSAWAVAVGVCVVLYPALSGQPAAPLGLAKAYGLATGAACLAALWAARHGGSRPRHLCALVLVAGEGGALFGLAAGPWQSWQPAQAGYILTFGALVLLHGWWLWIRR